MKSKPTKSEIHEIGVEYAAMKLIEQGISTVTGEGNGIDLTLDSGKTILIRAMSNETRVALMNGSLDTLKANYLMIISNLKYLTQQKVYIMTMDEAKNISIDLPYVVDNRSNFFINRSKYVPYRNNYNEVK